MKDNQLSKPRKRLTRNFSPPRGGTGRAVRREEDVDLCIAGARLGAEPVDNTPLATTINDTNPTDLAAAKPTTKKPHPIARILPTKFRSDNNSPNLTIRGTPLNLTMKAPRHLNQPSLLTAARPLPTESNPIESELSNDALKKPTIDRPEPTKSDPLAADESAIPPRKAKIGFCANGTEGLELLALLNIAMVFAAVERGARRDIDHYNAEYHATYRTSPSSTALGIPVMPGCDIVVSLSLRGGKATMTISDQSSKAVIGEHVVDTDLKDPKYLEDVANDILDLAGSLRSDNILLMNPIFGNCEQHAEALAYNRSKILESVSSGGISKAKKVIAIIGGGWPRGQCKIL